MVHTARPPRTIHVTLPPLMRSEEHTGLTRGFRWARQNLRFTGLGLTGEESCWCRVHAPHGACMRPTSRRCAGRQPTCLGCTLRCQRAAQRDSGWRTHQPQAHAPHHTRHNARGLGNTNMWRDTAPLVVITGQRTRAASSAVAAAAMWAAGRQRLHSRYVDDSMSNPDDQTRHQLSKRGHQPGRRTTQRPVGCNILVTSSCALS